MYSLCLLSSLVHHLFLLSFFPSSFSSCFSSHISHRVRILRINIGRGKLWSASVYCCLFLFSRFSSFYFMCLPLLSLWPIFHTGTNYTIKIGRGEKVVVVFLSVNFIPLSLRFNSFALSSSLSKIYHVLKFRFKNMEIGVEQICPFPLFIGLSFIFPVSSFVHFPLPFTKHLILLLLLRLFSYSLWL